MKISYIPVNIYKIIVFCARVYLLNWHLNLFMDIHYFLRNKTSYLAVFIKYAFSENKNRILQHFKVYQENIEPKRIQNNQIRNVISIFTDGSFMYLLQPVFEVSKCKVSVDCFVSQHYHRNVGFHNMKLWVHNSLFNVSF